MLYYGEHFSLQLFIQKLYRSSDKKFYRKKAQIQIRQNYCSTDTDGTKICTIVGGILPSQLESCWCFQLLQYNLLLVRIVILYIHTVGSEILSHIYCRYRGDILRLFNRFLSSKPGSYIFGSDSLYFHFDSDPKLDPDQILPGFNFDQPKKIKFQNKKSIRPFNLIWYCQL